MAVDPIRKTGGPHLRAATVQTHALFERHSRMVYGLCRALLRDPDDADDATQATFIAAYQSLLAGNRVREPAAWLATIARNECAARSRSRMREPLPLPDADLVQTQGPDAELERIAVVAELRQAIAGLPQKQREAVVLRDLYGLPYTEVGAALGISLASVESLLFRARRSLRVSLKTLAGGALTVPIAVREGVAQALPALGAGGGGAASGAVGIGLVAKLASGPATIKAAAGLAAAVTAGSIAVAGVEHGGTVRPPHRANDVVAHVAQAPSAHQALAAAAPAGVTAGASTTHHHSGHQGSGSGTDGSDDTHGGSGHGSSSEIDETEAPTGQQRGGEGSGDGGAVVPTPVKHDAGHAVQGPSQSGPSSGKTREQEPTEGQSAGETGSHSGPGSGDGDLQQGSGGTSGSSGSSGDDPATLEESGGTGTSGDSGDSSGSGDGSHGDSGGSGDTVALHGDDALHDDAGGDDSHSGHGDETPSAPA